ncbi:hypothetical protein DPMN_142825 [Dreissena polymorpha]|uniref:Uncharacterized protein n=1 Tax=Dreissena polymorpha TaxID=45954 RepID=A0A9D4GBZ9_DREPO|nr:hypothetical protein DPMN_142825 [Dreissena polymorpha]
MFLGFPLAQKRKTQVRPVCPPHWWSCCPAVPGPLQTGPLAGPGRRTLDDKQRVTSPLHLGEDSNPSSVEDVRLEGDGLCWISRATRRSSLYKEICTGEKIFCGRLSPRSRRARSSS